MSGDWLRLALVVAPAPFTLVAKTADWIASSVLLFVRSVVVAGWIVRHILGELVLHHECDRPLELAEPVVVLR